MNYKKEIHDFLKSSETLKNFVRDDYNYYLIKAPYNDTIDLLYGNNTYRSNLGFHDKFEYQGFYDKEKDEIYDISYDMYKMLGIEWNNHDYKSISELMKEFNVKINDIVTDYVKENKDEFYDAAKEYTSDTKEQDVYGFFINDIDILDYECNYDSNDEKNIFKYFDEGESYLYEIAGNYIEMNKEKIGKSLKNIDMKNKLLNNLNSDINNKIHKRRDVIKSLDNNDYKRVNVFICKNGKCMNFKIDVSAIECSWNSSYISKYSMSVKDRDDFDDNFGHREDFNIEDIYKIEYRNKPIYEDNNFDFSNKEEKEEISI